ncbi:MAG: hypothetical protein HYY59_02930, partial [Candidatus Omnitrophica bacterium]|nr:hypothetical protein [Candidatus Omnitrophota bacterium]
MLRITQVSGAQVTNTSGAFAIYPKITSVTVVPSPGDTGIWRTGETNHEVQWAEGSSELDFVDLLYSLDGGAFTLLTGGDAIASGPATGDSAGTKTTTGLTVPTTISTSNVIIRVRDDDPAFNDYVYLDSAPFQTRGKLTVPPAQKFPNDNVFINDVATLTKWTKTGVLPGGGDYSVELAVDLNDNLFQADSNTIPLYPLSTAAGDGVAGLAWDETAAAGISGPLDHVTNTAYLRIRDVTRPADTVVIYGPIKIAGGFSNVALADSDSDTPAGTFIANQAATLTWTRTGTAIPNVKVEYSLNNGTDWANLNETVLEGPGAPDNDGIITNDGTYVWTPTATTFSNVAALLRLTDPNNAFATGQSAAPFTLTTKTKVTNPEGTVFDTWDAGTTQTLTWTSTGTFSNAQILYAADGTNFTTDLTANTYDGGAVGTEYEFATTPNDGSYAWYIKATTPLGPTARIKVVDADHAYGLSVNSDAFRTKGSLTALKPGSEAIPDYTAGVAGTDIKWQRFGNIASVDICYAADGVSFPNPCNTIKDNFSMTADTMTITDWTPPQTIG